ncbi:hypothetical protein CBR_g41387 [Chara braunii]|uniref:Uncharacterized protein n=1 Tax=Chara braunii TaxID=69332 RepID=A0A388LVV6_CHABU|nr:hypothetical protein CBR_g41387 [Chara braunii]|eukprot:GBG86391.1 hypothetical protein CBR_g41387 [Chara braunii]
MDEEAAGRINGTTTEADGEVLTATEDGISDGIMAPEVGMEEGGVVGMKDMEEADNLSDVTSAVKLATIRANVRAIENEKRLKEEKKKREDEQKAAKKEEARVEVARKKEKEDEDAKRKWELKMLLAEQREECEKKRQQEKIEYEKKLEKMERLVRKIDLNPEGKRKGKQQVVEMRSSDDEEAEASDPETPLRDKRKRRDSTGAMENSPPVDTPLKVGRCEGPEDEQVTPASTSRRKGRGRSTKAEVQAKRILNGNDPWEGVPACSKYKAEESYRKVVSKALSTFYPETLKAMCRGAGVLYLSTKDAIDDLTETRVMYWVRGRRILGTSGPDTQAVCDEIRGTEQVRNVDTDDK